MQDSQTKNQASASHATGATSAAGTIDATDAAAASLSAGLPVRSLRHKAFIAFGAAVVYVVVIGALVGYERARMFMIVGDLERVHQREELLTRVNTTMANAILQVNEAYFLGARELNGRDVVLGVEAVQAGLYAISKFDDASATEAARLEPLLAHLVRGPQRDALIDLRRALHDQVRRLDALAAGVRAEKARLHASYRLNYDALSLTIAGFGLLGLVVFGSVVALFFTRMAWDLKKLRTRALQIVQGYRGPLLNVTRSDEVGQLMESVNRMQGELAQRETRLDMARAERMHQEKMAAVGSLAASIAHEINNPIAAITGVAEQIAETSRERGCPSHGATCRPQLILEHARRVATITRQIAVFSAPSSPHLELTDLNGLVESTCNFVRYDPRYRTISLATDLDRQLPAIELIADHVTQILMNLLVNSADALLDVERERHVTVSTRRTADGIELAVVDNGAGMTAAVLARATEEHFSTKPPGRGSGLGLAVCQKLIAQRGGTMTIESQPGQGTTVRVFLPLSGASERSGRTAESAQTKGVEHAPADH